TLEAEGTPQAPANPLLKAWQTPFETPPFAEIAPEHFLPAFEQAFADHSAEVAAITHDPATPDFANTITALERSGKLLSKVSAVFYDLVSAHSNPALLEIDKEVSPRMARHWNPIMMNAVLFGRIAMLHANRDGLPDSFIAAAKAAAEERGMAGKAIVTLSRSFVEPFLKSSDRRDLREKVFKAFTARGDNNNDNDNNAVIVEVLALREESA